MTCAHAHGCCGGDSEIESATGGYVYRISSVVASQPLQHAAAESMIVGRE